MVITCYGLSLVLQTLLIQAQFEVSNKGLLGSVLDFLLDKIERIFTFLEIKFLQIKFLFFLKLGSETLLSGTARLVF